MHRDLDAPHRLVQRRPVRDVAARQLDVDPVKELQIARRPHQPSHLPPVAKQPLDHVAADESVRPRDQDHADPRMNRSVRTPIDACTAHPYQIERVRSANQPKSSPIGMAPTISPSGFPM